jgi:hypothetical protein
MLAHVPDEVRVQIPRIKGILWSWRAAWVAMTNQRSAQLQAALRRRQLVRFTRPFEKGSVNGHIVTVGPHWFLLALVGDGIHFDGFACFRLRDVRRLEVPHPHARFVAMALKKRGERRPRKPRVSVASIEAILRSAKDRFQLVTIFRERGTDAREDRAFGLRRRQWRICPAWSVQSIAEAIGFT